jgi:S-DNA-T family DNA segregation ATPase FtsK/SpoIIIE
MPLESFAQDHQRLLPRTLENRLLGMLGRASGLVLSVLVAAAWLSLLTWSVADPSLTNATSGATSNLLGSGGAIFSDLMLQTLGLAAVFGMLAPTFWGLELGLAQRIIDFRLKACLFPFSVLALAGACSSLPVASSWPMRHGFGGILGDFIYSVAAGVLASVNPERAGAAAGLFFFAAGLAAMTHSIGLSVGDLGRLAPTRGEPPVLPWPSHPAAGSRWRPFRSLARRSRLSRDEQPAARMPSGLSPPDPDRDTDRCAAWPQQTWAAHAMAHHLPNPYAAAMPLPEPQPFDEPHPIAAPERGPLRRGASFDASTDRESRAIAERFAPASSEPAGRKRKATSLLAGLGLGHRQRGYRRPSLNLLARAPAGGPGPELTQSVLRGNARLLEDALAEFGVKGEIKEIRPGPVVTLYELEPVRGTKSARVIGLAEDIARSMSVASARVAVVPGRNAIGIELPNMRRETVRLRAILEAEPFRSHEPALPLALGKAIGGEPIVVDLARMPHLLVAGTTGSGMSVGINAMILSLLYRHAPADCRLLLLDPKMLGLAVYDGIPHLLAPVVTDPGKAVAALDWAVGEMEERYKRMAQLGVRNIDIYNNRVRYAKKRGEMLSRTVQTGFDARTGEAVYEKEALATEPMPYIVVVVDELADLMVVAGREIEVATQRLVQMSRAAGIHLIVATQRPSVDIVTGTIKSNFPARIGFKVASKIDSRTIINEAGAEQLLGQGDMLLSNGAGQVLRVHGALVTDEEVEAVVAALRQEGEPAYVEGLAERPAAEAAPADGERHGDDDLYDRAVAIVTRDRKASTSYIQRRLGICYNRAADLIERMQHEGIIGPASSTDRRDILAPGGPAALSA